MLWAIIILQVVANKMPNSLPKKLKKKGKPRSDSAPAATSLTVVKKKHKQWTDETMEAAMNAVTNENMPVLCASQMYNIPKTTIYDHISSKVLHGSKPRPKPYFSSAKEK